MTPPYTFRIMAALPGHESVELFRSTGKYSNHVWSFWTCGMAQDWTIWTEHPIDDRQCITRRPRIRAAHVAGVADKLRLYE